MMATVRVTHLAGDALQIEVRGHTLLADQPSADRDEAGPTPVELFVASLAACAAFYAERFLRRNSQPYQGLQVECDWMMRATDPARVARIALHVRPPAEVPDELRDRLLAAIDLCTVQNTLRIPPSVTVDIARLSVAGSPTGQAS